MNTTKTFSVERLKAAMGAKDWSASRLAFEIGMAEKKPFYVQNVHNWLNGTQPSGPMLVLLSQLLDVPLNEFYGEP